MNEQAADLPVKPDLNPANALVTDESEFSLLLDSARFNQLWRIACMFAKSELVPKHFQGKPENVLVAAHMALRLHVDPLMLMQASYIVHGRPGLEAKLVIALVNARGPFTGPIQWEFAGEGKTRSCTAYATHRKTGEVCRAKVDWALVEAEGWNKDRSYKDGSGVQKSKWNTMPDLMFQYRSAAFLARLFCPEVIMGLPTTEELEDITPAPLPLAEALAPPPKRSLILAPKEEGVKAEAGGTFDLIAAPRVAEAQVDASLLKEFVEVTARALEITDEELKGEAIATDAAFEEFWQAFLNWTETVKGVKAESEKPPSTRRTRGRRGAKSTQVVGGPGEGAAPGGDPGPPLEGITGTVEGTIAPVTGSEANPVPEGTQDPDIHRAISDDQIKAISVLAPKANVPVISILADNGVSSLSELTFSDGKRIIMDLQQKVTNGSV